MNWFNMFFWEEKFEFESDQTLKEIRAAIAELFEKTKGWNFSTNMVGEFKSNDEFIITPKWQVLLIRGIESKEAYLKGKLYATDFQSTKVVFTIRPNVSFAITFIVFFVWGLMLLVSLLIDGVSKERAVSGLVMTFIIPALLLLIAYSAKRRLAKRFIKFFNLVPLV